MKLKMIIGIIVVIILIFVGLEVWNFEGEIQTKQAILTNVEYASDVSYTLTFNDGSVLTFNEDNIEDNQEMYDYLVMWIGQEIIIEYCYAFDTQSHQLYSVEGVYSE